MELSLSPAIMNIYIFGLVECKNGVCRGLWGEKVLLRFVGGRTWGNAEADNLLTENAETFQCRQGESRVDGYPDYLPLVIYRRPHNLGTRRA